MTHTSDVQRCMLVAALLLLMGCTLQLPKPSRPQHTLMRVCIAADVLLLEFLKAWEKSAAKLLKSMRDLLGL